MKVRWVISEQTSGRTYPNRRRALSKPLDSRFDARRPKSEWQIIIVERVAGSPCEFVGPDPASTAKVRVTMMVDGKTRARPEQPFFLFFPQNGASFLEICKREEKKRESEAFSQGVLDTYTVHPKRRYTYNIFFSGWRFSAGSRWCASASNDRLLIPKDSRRGFEERVSHIPSFRGSLEGTYISRVFERKANGDRHLSSDGLNSLSRSVTK